MDFDDVKREIIHDIMSTEEGRQDLMDYAKGKIKDLREILEKYDDIFRKRMGTRINLSGRYLDEEEYILMSKLLPKTYEQWKDGGFSDMPNVPSLIEASLIPLKKYEGEPENFDKAKPGEIPQRMQESIDESKTNEFVANKIADMISDVMQNVRYYSSRALGMDPKCEDIAEEISYEVRSLIRTVHPEEIKGILDREEHIILDRVNNTIENIMEERKAQKRREGNVNEEEQKNNEDAFKGSLRVEGIDYSDVVAKHSNDDKKEEKGEDSKDSKIDILPSDLII